MIAMDDAGSTWHETTITGIVLQHAHPTVKFVDFNQRQEGATGADWLWWWVDATGEAFGMLVQAKRLKETFGRSRRATRSAASPTRYAMVASRRIISAREGSVSETSRSRAAMRASAVAARPDSQVARASNAAAASRDAVALT